MREYDIGAVLPTEVAKSFLRLSFAARVTLVNSLFGPKRLRSRQLAGIWLSLLEWAEQTGASEEERHTIARELLRLAPQGETAPVALSRLIAGPDGPSVRLIQMIISCRKRLRQALDLRNAIDGVLGPAVIILGDSTLKYANMSEGLITVPSPDNYESLTTKVCEALVAIRHRYGAAAVLKIDDDCVIQGPGDALNFFESVAGAEYVGDPAGSMHLDRTWHIGKCEAASPPIYGKRFRAQWANGPLYYLGPHAVDCLVTAYLSYPGEFENTWGIEDKCIGDTLLEHGIDLKSASLWKNAGLVLE